MMRGLLEKTEKIKLLFDIKINSQHHQINKIPNNYTILKIAYIYL